MPEVPRVPEVPGVRYQGAKRARGAKGAFAAAAAFVFVSVCAASAQPAGGLLVSPAELAGELGAPGLLVLHVHEREATYEAGHIPGARFIRYSTFATDEPGGLGAELPTVAGLQRVLEAAGVRADQRIVIYSPSLLMAARLFFTLDIAGHGNVALLDGGLRAWQAEGRPIETGASPAPPSPGAFTPRIDEARMATADWIQARLGSDALALVDVRPDPEYTGAPGNDLGSPGHLPGARQLTWNALVGDDGRFLPRAELATRLEAAGARPGRPVVAYCMVGMRASVVYFASRLLGYDTRLYDGSIIDWGRRGLPVVKGHRN